MANQLSLPSTEPLTDLQRPSFITDPWVRYFVDVGQGVNQAPNRFVDPVQLVGQHASIAATTMVPTNIPDGLYRISYYARVTTPADNSSSLTVTFAWTDHAQAMTISGAAIVGNTVTSFQQGVLPIFADAKTAITYSTTYATMLGIVDMQYELFIWLHQDFS